jgi:hypothetical protein
MNGKQGAEATIAAYPNRVVVSVRILSGNVGGAASLKLFEVTPGGNVEVSRKGSEHGQEDLEVPRPGSYYAEISDARGKKYRTQTVPVEQGFFDLAAKRAEEVEHHRALTLKRQAEAQRAKAQAAAAAQAAQASKAERNDVVAGFSILGIIVVAIALVFVFRYLTR